MVIQQVKVKTLLHINNVRTDGPQHCSYDTIYIFCRKSKNGVHTQKFAWYPLEYDSNQWSTSNDAIDQLSSCQITAKK